MTHDPLCDIQRETTCVWPGDKCHRCRLIARVREAERVRIVAIIRDHYTVAPLAAKPLLDLIEGQEGA